ncbi:MAG: cobalamin B12-binding domain-containing protein [Gammaproteobacteria bacterium]
MESVDKENDGNRFAAELLERSASGFAGFATNLMFEKSPGIKQRFQPDAFATWKTYMTQRILELAAAVGTGEPLLFSSRVIWSRKAFLARNQQEDDLVVSLSALKDVLADNLPAAASQQAVDYVDQAIDVLSQARPNEEDSELNPERPHDRLALLYLQSVLEGNAAQAIDDVLQLSKGDMSPMDVYTQILLPAQREVGRLWHLGDMNVAEEHLVTFATQRAMAVLVQSATLAAANGKTMVAAAATGNVHDIGLRAVSDVFQIAGWRTIFLGADVPMQELPATLTFFNADLLVLTAALSTQLPRVSYTITAVRDRCEHDVKILVGGPAFDEAQDIWRKVGADGYGPTIDKALTEANQLVGL